MAFSRTPRDIAERVASTYVQAFVGLLIASGFGVDGVAHLSSISKASVAALPAVLSLVKNLLTSPSDA